MKQRSSKIVAFPGKIRRPPATLRGSLDGGAKLGPFLNSRRRLWAQVIRECRRQEFEPETRRGFSHVKADGGVRAVRRGGRARTAPLDERIRRRSGYSSVVRVRQGEREAARQLEAFEVLPVVIRRVPEVRSTVMVTVPSNTWSSRSPASCRRQPRRMGTSRAVRFCLASTSVCRSALVASMVGAIPSSAARAFSTACRSSTMPIDSGSGFRSRGTSGQADGGSASAEVMVANSCSPCRSTSEE